MRRELFVVRGRLADSFVISSRTVDTAARRGMRLLLESRLSGALQEVQHYHAHSIGNS